MEGDVDVYKTTKNRLAHVLAARGHKSRPIIDAIDNAVVRTNSVVTHGLRFLKLYYIHTVDAREVPPLIDSTFVTNCFRAVMGTDAHRSFKHGASRQALVDFFRTHYRPLIPDTDPILSASSTSRANPYNNLTQILGYEAKKAVTQCETNVAQHFADHVDAFLRAVFNAKAERERMKAEKDTDGVAALNKVLREQKAAVLARATADLHALVQPHFAHIMPPVLVKPTAVDDGGKTAKKTKKKTKKKDEDKPLLYDLKARPNAYLRCMVYMGKFVESRGASLLSVFPQRTSGIPHYIRLDTSSIIEHLVDTQRHFPLLSTPLSMTNKLQLRNCLGEYANEVWALFFKTHTSCFRRSDRYVFANMIETDGVGVSILLRRADVVKTRYGTTSAKGKKKGGDSQDVYIDDVAAVDLADIAQVDGLRVVGVDPGKNAIITAVSCAANDFDAATKATTKIFSYTAVRRRKDLKVTKNRRRVRNLRAASVVADGRSVQEVESDLSKHNARTLDFTRCKAYIADKNRADVLLQAFYHEPCFRLGKFHTHTNRCRSEARMLADFERVHGPPSTTVVAFGDFEQKDHMKHKPPTMGVGTRRLFRRGGYRVYLVDEHRTSVKCFKCADADAVNENFLYVQDPRRFKQPHPPLLPATRKCHAVLRCQTCTTVWNRDVCGALNIGRIAAARVRGTARPAYLRRGADGSPSHKRDLAQSITAADVGRPSVKRVRLSSVP